MSRPRSARPDRAARRGGPRRRRTRRCGPRGRARASSAVSAGRPCGTAAAAGPAGRAATGSRPPAVRSKACAGPRSSLTLTPTKRTPCSAVRVATSLSVGASARQGAHQDAQKFRTTTWPRRSATSSGSPSSVVPDSSGAGWRSATAMRPSSRCRASRAAARLGPRPCALAPLHAVSASTHASAAAAAAGRRDTPPVSPTRGPGSCRGGRCPPTRPLRGCPPTRPLRGCPPTRPLPGLSPYAPAPGRRDAAPAGSL